MCEDFIVLVSTDRQSAFDRALAQVPFKGAVLNRTSAWWFDRVKSEGIAAHHVLAVPDANVTIGKKSTVFPIEFVMRGYLTGSTSTSIWKVSVDTMVHVSLNSSSHCTSAA
jgi:phosphoribosylaminoimidazole-succinocarboxamide synthase